MQKFIAVGNLGKDPEIRFLPSGQSVVNFSIATSRRWKDKDSGEKKEETEWHNCEAWGKLAEIIGEYLKKGSKIAIEGRLKTTMYEKDGHKFYPTKIIVEEMEMLDSKDKSGNTSAEYQASEIFALKRSQALTIHWSSEAFRLFGDSELRAFDCLTIA